ncbi:feruloyl esterase B precursor [Polyplosphaeria fusca]|uniref:Carboxylic ester hydrolase n=1 Tax=Polyplosphaeria fusca TaxID=682080 RepID=A0A9P4QWL0_9PLEO|nr:feruloyl esterase B precursor [Polyplosphaeria fusca]
MLKSSLLLSSLAIGRAFGADDASDSQTPRCETSAFNNPTVPGVKILSLIAEPRHNHTIPHIIPAIPGVTDLNFCEVEIHLTHPGTDDNVRIAVWLPFTAESWNGRWQSTGGGGFTTGMFDFALGNPVKDGYAAGSTDGGHSSDGYGDISWALKADKTINYNLLQNHGTRSLADMTQIGKIITKQYYGIAPHHSYWNGCSQGGRQGYMMAAQYPHLVDGILASAPALGLTDIVMANFHPNIVMKEAGFLMSQCEFNHFRKRLLDECDVFDGAKDGIIMDPEDCSFDPAALVGEKFDCDGTETEVTQVMADIVRKIQEGPRTRFGGRIGYGYAYGTTMEWIANITIKEDGQREPQYLGMDSFIATLLVKDPTFNISTLSYSDYIALWAQANGEVEWLNGDRVPDLNVLRASGTKLLSWHGIADPVIPYQISKTYRERMEAVMGGSSALDEYYRFFLVPGVEHCAGGNGAYPAKDMEQLVDWVEKGEAPRTLFAEKIDEEGELVTRDLCRFPGKMKYLGIGDHKRASSWGCVGVDDSDDENLVDQADESFLGGLKDRLAGLGMGLKIN